MSLNLLGLTSWRGYWNGSSGSGVSDQPLIWYTMDDYNTKIDGSRYLVDVGDVPKYDGNLFSGRNLALDATQELPIEIVHQLGSELQDTVNNVGWGTTGTAGTFTINSGTSFDLAVTTTGTETARPFVIMSTLTKTIGETYKIYFNATVTSGTARITLLNDGGLTPLDHTITNGENVIEYTALDSTTVFTFYFDGTALFDISITGLSYKQITTPANTAITYWDATAKEYVQIGADGVGSSTPELMGNGDFSDTDLSMYTFINATGNVVSGELVVTTTLSFHAVRQNIPTVSGVSYTFSFYVKKGTQSTYKYSVWNGSDIVSPTVYDAGDGISFKRIDVNFVATGASAYVYMLRDSLSSGTSTFDNISVKEALPVSTTYTFTNQSVGEIAPTTKPFTPADIALMNADNQLLGQLALGSTTTELSLVTADLYGYYPVSESSRAYVVDSLAGYGSEIVTNGDFTITTGWTAQSSWNISGGNAVLDGLQASTNFLFQDLTIPPVVGSYVVISLDVISYTSGFVGVTINGGTSIHNLGASVGTHSLVVQVESGSDTTLYIRGAVGDAFTIDNISVREATASEVSNYDATVRTNGDTSPYGMQLVGFKQDSLGLPTAVADAGTIEFNGDGRYADTGWIPPIDVGFSIECVLNLSKNTTYSEIMGVSSCKLSIRDNGYFYFYSDKEWVYTTSYTAGLTHVIAIRNSDGTTKLYLNSVEKGSSAPFVSAVRSDTFKIGAYDVLGNISDYFKTPNGLFKVHPTVLDQTEVTAAYTAAKVIYPSLP